MFDNIGPWTTDTENVQGMKLMTVDVSILISNRWNDWYMTTIHAATNARHPCYLVELVWEAVNGVGPMNIVLSKCEQGIQN